MEKNEVRELLREIAKDIHDQNDLDVFLSTVSEGLRPSLLAKIKPYLDFPPELWGVWDTKSECWFGTEKGPQAYSSKTLAEVAAQVVDTRLGQQPGRTRAIPIHQDRTYKKRDTIDTKMGAEEAIRKLEEGLA